MNDAVVIGKFGRPHGLNGEVRFFAYNPDSEVMTPGAELVLDNGTSIAIGTVRTADKFLIVRVDGCQSREDAEALRNHEASVERASLPDPSADEFYLVDVIGFEVWAPDHAGDEPRLLGRVKGWLDIGPSDIMAVTGPDISGRLLIPNIDHVVDKFDFDADRVNLHPLEQWAPESD